MEFPAPDGSHGRGVEKVEARGPVHRDLVGLSSVIHMHFQQGGSFPSRPPRLPWIFRLEHPRVAHPGKGDGGFKPRIRRCLPFIASSTFDACGGCPAMAGFVRRLVRRFRRCRCGCPIRRPGGLRLRRPVHSPPRPSWNFLTHPARRLSSRTRLSLHCRRNRRLRRGLCLGPGWHSRPLRSFLSFLVLGGARVHGFPGGWLRLVGVSPRGVQQANPQGLKGVLLPTAGVHGKRQKEDRAMEQRRAQQAIQKAAHGVYRLTNRSVNLLARFSAGCDALNERRRERMRPQESTRWRDLLSPPIVHPEVLSRRQGRRHVLDVVLEPGFDAVLGFPAEDFLGAGDDHGLLR